MGTRSFFLDEHSYPPLGSLDFLRSRSSAVCPVSSVRRPNTSAFAPYRLGIVGLAPLMSHSGFFRVRIPWKMPTFIDVINIYYIFLKLYSIRAPFYLVSNISPEFVLYIFKFFKELSYLDKLYFQSNPWILPINWQGKGRSVDYFIYELSYFSPKLLCLLYCRPFIIATHSIVFLY